MKRWLGDCPLPWTTFYIPLSTLIILSPKPLFDEGKEAPCDRSITAAETLQLMTGTSAQIPSFIYYNGKAIERIIKIPRIKL